MRDIIIILSKYQSFYWLQVWLCYFPNFNVLDLILLFASTLAIWYEFFPIIGLFCVLGDLNLILSTVPKIRLYFYCHFASLLRDLILILSRNLPLCTLKIFTSILSKVSRFTTYFHYLFTNTLKHISFKILKI